ncbi:MAG: hypothetical protein ACYDCL_09430 [Myxococcales bacterium]
MKRPLPLLLIASLSACCLTPESEGPSPDAGIPDAGIPDAGIPDAGAGCTADADCGAGDYCDLSLTYCPSRDGFNQPLVTAGLGVCHRDCQNGSCSCQDDADCPLSSCDQGRCTDYGADCPLFTCPAGCPVESFDVSSCPVCLCAACPGADAGTPDAGSSDGGCLVNSDCPQPINDECNAFTGMSVICYQGVCTCAGAVPEPDAGCGVCSGGTTCCTLTNAGMAPGYACEPLSADGGCPTTVGPTSYSSCTYDPTGAVATCSIYTAP